MKHCSKHAVLYGVKRSMSEKEEFVEFVLAPQYRTFRDPEITTKEDFDN